MVRKLVKKFKVGDRVRLPDGQYGTISDYGGLAKVKDPYIVEQRGVSVGIFYASELSSA